MIGLVGLQDKTPSLVVGQITTTTTTSLNTTEVIINIQSNTSVIDEPGRFVSPEDANFIILYRRLGGERM